MAEFLFGMAFGSIAALAIIPIYAVCALIVAYAKWHRHITE